MVTQLDMTWESEEAEAAYHKEWAEKLEINANVNCSTCHR
jgi:hypothetical protein